MSRENSAGLCFECTQCGGCCTNRGEYAYVYVGAAEVRALARLLGMGVLDFRREYTFVDEYGWTQLTFKGENCSFLDGVRCSVYAARPIQCRTFPFWRDLVKDGEWTQEARDLCEGVGRGRPYSQDEAEELMVAFGRSEED